MSKSSGVGIDSEAARRIRDDGSEFKLPGASREELRTLSPEEWLQRYGDVLSSERHFQEKDPNWAQNPSSWWYKETGRGGPEPPLWMRPSYHLPDLDCPPTGDRCTAPVDQRDQEEQPLWAERMGLTGSKQGQQSATIYGHRREYLPAHKTEARSLYERYQPAYQRIVNEEIPDTADPPDGRFWKAGVAQGVATNPYEKRLALSGRRKPIVIGPRSISVIVDGEGHTLANVVRDVSWLHPYVEFSGYSLEHPVYRHVNMRVQTTSTDGQVGAEQVMAETLELTQDLFKGVADAMRDAFETWPERKATLEAERAEQARAQRERDVKMTRWLAQVEGKSESWDPQLEIELFGKLVTTELKGSSSQ